MAHRNPRIWSPKQCDYKQLHGWGGPTRKEPYCKSECKVAVAGSDTRSRSPNAKRLLA